MNQKSSDAAFGMVLSRYLQRNPTLNRDRMAHGIQQDPAVVTDMCKGRRLSGPRARERVLSIIRWLHEHRVLGSIDEADTLLQAAHMAELNIIDTAEADLFQVFDDPDLHRGPEQFDPFIISHPITHPCRFFGRHYELNRLFNLWDSSLQNALILGPRHSGKTSLLYYLQRLARTPTSQLRPNQRQDWLARSRSYNWIFVDFLNSNMGRREHLFRYLIRRMGLPAPKRYDLDHFLATVYDYLRRPTIILFDEVGIVRQRYSELDKSFWDGLRSLSTTPARNYLAFVLAAVDSLQTMTLNSINDWSYYNITGYMTTLGPLAEDEAYELIASSPSPFNSNDTDWIIANSRRWPLLLQLLCHERLSALRHGETDTAWREHGLRQINLYRHLLQAK